MHHIDFFCSTNCGFLLCHRIDKWYEEKFPKVDAASRDHVANNPSDGTIKSDHEEDTTKKKKRTKEKVGFRDRKVFSKKTNIAFSADRIEDK